MSKRSIVVAVALSVVALAVSPAWAAYVEIATWATILGPAGPTQHYGAFVDGNSSYHFLSLNNAPRITRVDNLSGVQTMSVVMSTAQWNAAGGGNSPTPFYGFSHSGTYLQCSDSQSDAVWRIDKATGAVTQYVSKAAIQAFTGQSNVSLTTPGDTAPDGEYVVYDSTSQSVIKTVAGAPTTYLSSAQLISIAGTVDVGGGLTFDLNGALYWQNNTSKGIYRRTAGGNLSQVLTQAEIIAVAGDPNGVTLNKDIYYAPDGMIYFQENKSGNVLRFNPANPAASLSIYITKADLLAGPAASANVYQLSWYNGNLAWNVVGAKGLYGYVPEPTALALLAVGALCLRRRG